MFISSHRSVFCHSLSKLNIVCLFETFQKINVLILQNLSRKIIFWQYFKKVTHSHSCPPTKSKKIIDRTVPLDFVLFSCKLVRLNLANQNLFYTTYSNISLLRVQTPMFANIMQRFAPQFFVAPYA